MLKFCTPFNEKNLSFEVDYRGAHHQKSWLAFMRVWTVDHKYFFFFLQLNSNIFASQSKTSFQASFILKWTTFTNNTVKNNHFSPQKLPADTVTQTPS
jgi:hypothetical protein